LSAAFATIYPVPLLARAPEGLISYAGAIDKPADQRIGPAAACGHAGGAGLWHARSISGV
jgi:hypothetical protein